MEAAGVNGPGGDLFAEVERLLATLESHPDPAVREQVAALLQAIDAVHRTALTHLVASIQGLAGEAFINRLTADPAIRLLLMSYDLLAVDRRVLAEEALDAVRGHLHAHGVDVELERVVGGAVYVKLHGVEPGGAVAAVRHDLEEALQAGLLGFQELVLGEARGAPQPGLVQLGGRARKPVFRVALPADDLAVGRMKGVEVEGQPILLANIGGTVHAVANRCGDGPLPLEFGRLEGGELLCSWHGCRYDLRSGKRLDGGEERLAVYPVAVEGGEIRVAVGVEPAVAK